MTPEQLAEIKARVLAATPGPWEMIHDDDEMCMNLYAVQRKGGDQVDTEARDLTHIICATLVQTPKLINHGASSCKWDFDADFIAHARTDIPALLAALEAARAEAARLQAQFALLQDESVVHTNILRGLLPLSRMNALHIAGATDYDSVKAENTMLKIRLVDLLEDMRRSDAAQLQQSVKLAQELVEALGATVRDNPPPRITRHTPSAPGSWRKAGGVLNLGDDWEQTLRRSRGHDETDETGAQE